jgi:hypothetical protein
MGNQIVRFSTLQQADFWLAAQGYTFDHHECWAFTSGFDVFRNRGLGMSATLRRDRYSKDGLYDLSVYPTPAWR